MNFSAEAIRYTLIMLAAGIGVPLLASMNSALGIRLGSPAAAAVFLFAIALLTACMTVAVTGPKAMLEIAGAPKHLLFGGVLIAFYALSITYVGPKIGIGNAVFIVLLGQLISAAIIDHFGLFGARVSPITLTRFAGILFMGAGVFLAQRA